MLPPWLFCFGLLGCGDSNHPSNPTPVECETGGIQATMGSDHGPPWVPPGEEAVDETSTPVFDVGNTFDFGGPPPPLGDPTVWEIDPSGVHYRRPTQNEITKNRWHPDVLLVAFTTTFVNAVKGGTTNVALQLPLADPPGWPQEDLPILAVTLTLRGSHNRVSMSETRQNPSGSEVVEQFETAVT